MNLATFFDHWKIAENPFKGEEARQDHVFWRLEGISGPDAVPAPSLVTGTTATTHPDFEKILGDVERPSTAIVFGEKGSGKTAIRIQLTERVVAHNRARPDAKVLLIPYDDLNPILDRFCERTPLERKTKDKHPDASPLSKLRLVDHIDAMLSIAVPRIIDQVLHENLDAATRPAAGGTSQSSPGVAAAAPGLLLDVGPDARKRARKSELAYRNDLLVLQAVYDRPDRAAVRTKRLRRALRVSPPLGGLFWTFLAYTGWLAPAYVVYYGQQHEMLKFVAGPYTYTLMGVTALYLAALIKRSVYDRLRYISLGHRIRKQVRVLARGDASFGRSLRQLPSSLIEAGVLPLSITEETRYAMVERLKRVLKPFGYTSILLVVDRVDEPTAIAGEPERMKAVIWPLLNNKFLQHPGLGVKMLLPMELRHALFRESSSFFQEARLDKQNLIERLAWTGPMLYDLCNARLQACRPQIPDQRPIALLDLFAEDVTRQELTDALDQMHQPRDAFKLLYQCLVDHCSSVSHEAGQFRIPRLVLDNVRKQQVERVKQLYKGVRPA